MFITSKVGIAALAAAVGVGVPFSFWALQPRGEPRVGFTTIEARGVTDLPSNDGVPLTSPSPVATPSWPGGVEATPAAPETSAPEVTTSALPPTPILVFVATATAPSPPSPSPPLVTEMPQQRSSPVRCGAVTCPEDQECCNASCSICVAPGGGCTNKDCGQRELAMSEMCGMNTCNVGQVCCNASCGLCTRPSDGCSHRICDGPTIPFSAPCGRNTCNVGQICCNASCGICAAPDAQCSQVPCG